MNEYFITLAATGGILAAVPSEWAWLGELGGFGALGIVLYLTLNKVMARQDRQDESHAAERVEWGTRMDRHAEMHRDEIKDFGDKIERAIRDSST